MLTWEALSAARPAPEGIALRSNWIREYRWPLPFGPVAMVALVAPLACVGEPCWSVVSKTRVAAAPSSTTPPGPSGRTMFRLTVAEVQTPPVQEAAAASLACPTGP